MLYKQKAKQRSLIQEWILLPTFGPSCMESLKDLEQMVLSSFRSLFPVVTPAPSSHPVVRGLFYSSTRRPQLRSGPVVLGARTDTQREPVPTPKPGNPAKGRVFIVPRLPKRGLAYRKMECLAQGAYDSMTLNPDLLSPRLGPSFQNQAIQNQSIYRIAAPSHSEPVHIPYSSPEPFRISPYTI